MDSDEHCAVIRRLFTVAEVRMAAAADGASGGQATDLTPEQAVRFGNDLVLAGQEMTALGEAIVLLAAGL